MIEVRPLYSREVEEAFVGALLLDGELAKESTIKPEQLFMSRLRMLLAAIQRLCKKGEPIDPVSVIEEVGLDNVESVGGISYVTDLAARVYTTALRRISSSTSFINSAESNSKAAARALMVLESYC